LENKIEVSFIVFKVQTQEVLNVFNQYMPLCSTHSKYTCTVSNHYNLLWVNVELASSLHQP